MLEATRIQAYLRETARGFYETVPVPPFTAFFNPRDPLRHFNYAIPDEPVEGNLAEALAALRGAFRSRERLPRLEYVGEFAPALADALEAVGFELELHAPLMTCRTADIVDPDPIDGFEVVSGIEDPHAYLAVGRAAFGESPPTDDAVASWLERRNPRAATLVGLLDGEPVAVASATPPLDGLSEVAGVGVLEAARRRGVGGAMTAAASRAAAEHGAEIVLLSPGSDGAQSVYRRVGFRPALTTLYYADPG